MTITIIGTGLIGGSLAIGLRGFQTKIIGVDKNKEHTKIALEMGLVDAILGLKEAVKISELIILAIPVDSAREILPQILDEINNETVVVDMGSTKVGICKAVENHPKRRNFVAAHPIAGTEYSGPKAAIHGLFNDKVAIIADKEFSADFALQTVEKMFKLLNMRVIYLSSETHDLHIAYVSHLSHISSFTLGLTVLEIEKDESQIFNMAGSGFASTVRLAKSSPEMWAPIFEQNAQHLSEALDIYIENLKKFKYVIENKLCDDAKVMMKKANKIKKILN